MKAKKIFGVVILISTIAVIASTVALYSDNVEKYEIIQTDQVGVHSSDYSWDLNDLAVLIDHHGPKGPDNGYPDEPIGANKGPDDGYIDEPIGGLTRGPDNGYPDEPIGVNV